MLVAHCQHQAQPPSKEGHSTQRSHRPPPADSGERQDVELPEKSTVPAANNQPAHTAGPPGQRVTAHATASNPKA